MYLLFFFVVVCSLEVLLKCNRCFTIILHMFLTKTIFVIILYIYMYIVRDRVMENWNCLFILYVYTTNMCIQLLL